MTRVVRGCNDVATTHPEYVKYFVNQDDIYSVARWSEKRVYIECPDCGNIVLKRVCDLISYPFNCKRCGDKSSYPNKYVYEFLLQLSKLYHFDVSPEHIFHWSKGLTSDGKTRRIYDFLLTFNEQEIIIEVHGGQHFDGSFCQYPGARTLEDELENDVYKKDLAIANGIQEENYIVIDARKSNSNWIKNSILHSNIMQIFKFNINDIDWEKCESVACNNLVKMASELWNNGIKNTTDIGKQIGKTTATAITYLKKGKALGWCDYTPQYIRRYTRKPILCIDNKMAFESADVCEECSMDLFGVYMNAACVQNVACGQSPTYKGMKFIYITKDELLVHYQQYPDLTFMDEYFINNSIIN